MDEFSQKTSAKIKKRNSKNKTEFDLRYLVMHTNNLAICMAAGFICPRFENGAVRDHNYRSDVLLLSSLPIPDHYFLEAFGDLNYGSVCVLELRITNNLVGARILPFSYVDAVIFSSESEKDEFSAKLSGYSDIPDYKIPLKVDEKIFPVAGNALRISFTPDNNPSFDQSFYYYVDKLSGLVFALIFALNKLKDPKKIEKFSSLSELNSPISTPIDFIKLIIQPLELISISEDSFFLLERLCNHLISNKAKNGFDPKLFLDELKRVDYDQLSENQKKIADGFCKHSLDILELRRDLTSLEDESGKVIPRAILLFMLSPDSNKLEGLFSTYPKLGNNVYLVASMLVGCFAGASTLPSDIKSFSNGSALILSDFVFDLVMGKVGKFQFESSFNEDGICKTRLVYKDKKVIDIKSNPDVISIKIFNALEAQGQKVTFSKDGTLLVMVSNDLCSVKIKFELTYSFWCPSTLSVKASTTLPLRNINKSILELLASEANPSEKGILLTIQTLGKSYAIDLGMFSTIDNFTNLQAQYVCKEIFIKFQDLFKKLN
jgi:hypothetical protein